MTRADLRSARLVKADLYQARLFKATLSEADCSGAYLRRADLTQSCFAEADLTKADLMETNLVNSNMTGSTLIGTEFSGANLTGVDLRKAIVGWTKFGSIDLTQVVGLDQLQHVGPSMLGFDTALLSHKKLSKQFLQGCGISEGVIQAWDNMYGHPVERITCFLRYAPDDASFAQHLYETGQEKGLRCWLDEMPKQASERKARRSPTTYESNELVFYCCSKASLTSWWANDEIERLLEREKKTRQETNRDVRFFYPINLDGFMFSGDWKHKKEKQIAKISVDFVGWRRNKEKFDQELTKLIQKIIDGKT